jgi:hypothetical protein
VSDPNIYRPELDEPAGREPHAGFLAQRSYLGRRLGTKRLGASLWHVPPGEAAYPYHFHLGEEELLVVIDGTGAGADGRGLAPARARRGAVIRDGRARRAPDRQRRRRDARVPLGLDGRRARHLRLPGLGHDLRRRARPERGDAVPYWTDAVPPVIEER